jgi:hypothetical protein
VSHACLLLLSAAIVGISWVALSPATATSLTEPGLSSPKVTVTSVEKVGYWRRQYRRYGYPAPYAYYPPAYGYYPPPVVYAYPPAVYGYQAAAPAYSPPVHGEEAPPPAAGPSAEQDYGNYPPTDGDYPAADGEYGDYPANGY